MRTCFLLFFVLLFIDPCHSQVGINTASPQGVFHIDGAKNTSGTANASDDFLIDFRGYVGVGTVDPQAKLDIMGNVIITGEAGTPTIPNVPFAAPVADQVLTSDSQGIGSWKDFDASTGVAVWTVNTAAATFADGTGGYVKADLTKPATDKNEVVESVPMGFVTSTSVTSSILTVPKGTYLIIMDFDLPAYLEYGNVSIMTQGGAQGTGWLYRVFYLEQLNGGSTVLTFTADTNVELMGIFRTTAAKTSGDLDLTRYSNPPFNRVTALTKVTFISLSK